MKLNALPKIVERGHKRPGRGHGSGKGKTAGRGTKGQKARNKVRLGFEGGQLSIINRLPLYRGKMRNRPVSKKFLPINFKVLNILPNDTVVNNETLIKYRIVTSDALQRNSVKILGDGELKVKLTIALPISKSAQKKVEAAGGKVVASTK